MGVKYPRNQVYCVQNHGKVVSCVYNVQFYIVPIDIKTERQEKLDRTRSNEMVHEIVYETVNICEPERGMECVECSTFKF